MPTLPIIYTKLSNILASPDVTVLMISNIIAEDNVIAGKVLRLANSSFYGFSRKIGSLQHAVVILGLNEIRNLVLTTSVIDAFKDLKSDNAFQIQKFWEHSLACATASRVLAEAARLTNPEEVFAGGLLHDIGKLIYAFFFPEEFERIVAEVEDHQLPLIEAEEKILGLSHAKIGTELAAKWHLPPPIVEMIQHHQPEDTTKYKKEVMAVDIGNSLSIALGIISWGEKQVPIITDKTWGDFGLKITDLEFIITRIDKLFREKVAILQS